MGNLYQCPQWENCTANTDPDSHICEHVEPHEWITADGDECNWRPSDEGHCSQICIPVGCGEKGDAEDCLGLTISPTAPSTLRGSTPRHPTLGLA